jgi:hypothetical protein
MTIHIRLDIPHDKDDTFQTIYGLRRMRLEMESENKSSQRSHARTKYSFSFIETSRLLTSVFFSDHKNPSWLGVAAVIVITSTSKCTSHPKTVPNRAALSSLGSAPPFESRPASTNVRRLPQSVSPQPLSLALSPTADCLITSSGPHANNSLRAPNSPRSLLHLTNPGVKKFHRKVVARSRVYSPLHHPQLLDPHDRTCHSTFAAGLCRLL